MRRISILLLVFFTWFTLAAWSQARPQWENTISAPGAGTGAGQGTWVNTINSLGEVAGWYVDGNNVYHGFISSLRGEITDVNAWPAGTAAYQGTLIEGMNSAGVTTGYYADSNNVYHGFVRAPDGQLRVINVPSAGTAAYQGTLASNINAAGAVLGIFIDASYNEHYFLYSPYNGFTIFDAPDEGAGVSALGWGYPDELNDLGAAVGMFIDGNNIFHGWLRTPDGEITRIDVPAAGTASGEGTYVLSINWKGLIVGGYLITASDPFGHSQGFLRDADGRFTTFAPPTGMTSVSPNDINARGEVVGTCWIHNAAGQNVGGDEAFSLAPHGAYTVFSLPGAGTGNFQGTYGIAVNQQGWIAGTITDDNSVTWSYVMIP